MLLSVTNLSKAYGDNQVLNGVSFTMHAGDKWGLVGANGVGKSTLIKIVMGEVEADTGSVAIGPGVEIGYLPQVLGGGGPDDRPTAGGGAGAPARSGAQAARAGGADGRRRAADLGADAGGLWTGVARSSSGWAAMAANAPRRGCPGRAWRGAPGARPPVGDALRRRESARGAGGAALAGAGAAAARRADQPPGLCGAGLAGRLSGRAIAARCWWFRTTATFSTPLSPLLSRSTSTAARPSSTTAAMTFSPRPRRWPMPPGWRNTPPSRRRSTNCAAICAAGWRAAWDTRPQPSDGDKMQYNYRGGRVESSVAHNIRSAEEKLRRIEADPSPSRRSRCASIPTLTRRSLPTRRRWRCRRCVSPMANARAAGRHHPGRGRGRAYRAGRSQRGGQDDAAQDHGPPPCAGCGGRYHRRQHGDRLSRPGAGDAARRRDAV